MSAAPRPQSAPPPNTEMISPQFQQLLGVLYSDELSLSFAERDTLAKLVGAAVQAEVELRMRGLTQ